MGTYSNCNWTGIGHKITTSSRSNLLLRSGTPGMSEDILSQTNFRRIARHFKDMEDADGMVYQKSWVTKYNITRVPPKHQPTAGRVHEMNKKKGDTLKYFYPDKIIDVAIGSNLGLIQIMRHEHDKIPLADRIYYRLILSDVNIFMRMMKVFFTLHPNI